MKPSKISALIELGSKSNMSLKSTTFALGQMEYKTDNCVIYLLILAFNVSVGPLTTFSNYLVTNFMLFQILSIFGDLHPEICDKP